jgi:hypothetical protein
MSAKQCVDDILLALQKLPVEKLAEVRDFVLSLKNQAQPTSDPLAEYSWTEEELQQLSAAVLEYGNKVAPWEE